MKHLKNITQQDYIHRPSLTPAAVFPRNLHAVISIDPPALEMAPPDCQNHNDETKCENKNESIKKSL
jgi:hypothetical protein